MSTALEAGINDAGYNIRKARVIRNARPTSEALTSDEELVSGEAAALA
jgi:hypothetical protein